MISIIKISSNNMILLTVISVVLTLLILLQPAVKMSGQKNSTGETVIC